MNEETLAPERNIDRWFAFYGNDHQHPTNQWIHVICVPAIFWSIIALLWCIPVPGTFFRDGAWGAVALFLIWAFYNQASRRLAFGMLVLFIAAAWSNRALLDAIGRDAMWKLALAVFVIAWIGQFIGHSKLFEGKKPSFFTDLKYLLVGPLWVLAKFYRLMGWKF